MTQNAPTAATPTVFRVWGKDRLSDPWLCFEARFRWQAERWAEQRAFVLRELDGQPRIAEVAVEGRTRIEFRRNGTWEPYTAWQEGANGRFREIDWVRAEKDRSDRTFRVVIEDEPDVIVGL
jgi:hypothetical protein